MSEDNVINDTGWQVISQSNTHKRKLTPPPTPKKNNKKSLIINDEITSDNRYAILAETMVNDPTEESSLQHEPVNIKPPPIFIPNVTNISKMTESFKTQISKAEFSYKAMLDGQLRVMTITSNAYRKLVYHLDEQKIVYHSYQLKEKRAYRVVVKNLHYSTPIDDIKNELMMHGFETRNITNIRSRVDKKEMNMFFVDLDPDVNNKQIYDLKYLCNAVIKVEPPRRTTEIIQCHRCQEFGHTKNYCKKPFACVKCGLGHPTLNCKKPVEEPPKCIHCLQSHTANYRGCQIYRELIDRKNNMLRNRPIRKDFTPNNPFFIDSNNSKSYADMVKSQSNERKENTNTFEKIEILLNKQIELTNTLLNMMSTLLNKLCK